VYPIKRICRDLRLASIWTGTNEVMSAITASECTGNVCQASRLPRDYEADSVAADEIEEKVYE
jgi:hypothetical protein